MIKNNAIKWYEEITGKQAYCYNRDYDCDQAEEEFIEWMENIVQEIYPLISDIRHQAIRKNKSSDTELKNYLEFDLDIIAEKSQKCINLYLNNGDII